MTAVWQVLNIAAASLIGVSVAALFGRNVLVLLLTPVGLGMIEGGLIMAARALAPEVEDTPSVWTQLSNPILLPAVLVASGFGVGIAAFLLSRGERKATPIWIPGLDDTKRGPNWRARHWVGHDAPKVEAPPPAAPPPLFPERRVAPQPVVDIAATSPPPALRPPLAPLPPAPVPAENKRAHVRRRAVLAGLLAAEDGSTFTCTIRDLSVRGAQVRLSGATPLPRQLWLIDQSNGIAHEGVVMWRDALNLGLRFNRSIDLASATGPQGEALRRFWRAQ